MIETAKLEPVKDSRQQRLVIEIAPADDKSAAKRPFATASIGKAGLATIQPPVPRPAVRPDARAQRAWRPLIVLDPGHGGHDSGAMRNGTVEKDVVLAFGKALRDKLNATGRYKVLMTRDNDTFVPLEERREFAEDHKAALFIAIHADYVTRSNVRGATIYSLREGVANELARSPGGSRATDLLTPKDLATVKAIGADAGAVRNILADLVHRETQATKERTGTFVKSVIEYMGQSTELKESPDRSAAFAVLTYRQGAGRPDRARLRQQQAGRRAAEIRPVARQGGRFHHYRHRQLLQPSGRPPADVTARALPPSTPNENSRPEGAGRCVVAINASHPLTAMLSQCLLGGCSGLTRQGSVKHQSGCW